MQCLCSHQEHWHSLSLQWTNGCKKRLNNVFFLFLFVFSICLQMSYQLCTKGILLKVENASKSAPTEHSMPKVIVQQTRGASPMEDSDVTEQDVKKKKAKILRMESPCCIFPPSVCSTSPACWELPFSECLHCHIVYTQCSHEGWKVSSAQVKVSEVMTAECPVSDLLLLLHRAAVRGHISEGAAPIEAGSAVSLALTEFPAARTAHQFLWQKWAYWWRWKLELSVRF